jgi:hypothetical protein
VADLTAPVAVLVVPAEGDPGGLKTPGSCGSRPPLVYHDPDDGTWRDWGHVWHRAALPLWWDGALVPEGWDRARRVEETVQRSGEVLEPWPLDPMRRGGARYVQLLARALVTAGLASRVVLLDRVDGRLVERGGDRG